MPKEYKLDRTAFSMGTFEDASNTVAYWRTHPITERLRAAWMLTCRAYGYTEDNPPKFDRTFFKMRKLEDNGLTSSTKISETLFLHLINLMFNIF